MRALRRGGRRGSRCRVVVLVVWPGALRRVRRLRHRYVRRGAEDMRPQPEARLVAVYRELPDYACNLDTFINDDARAARAAADVLAPIVAPTVARAAS